MEIPQNILKELEERKARAILDQAQTNADLPAKISEGNLGGRAQNNPQGQTSEAESQRSDLGKSGETKPPAGGLVSFGFGFKKFFRGKKTKPVLASVVEAPERQTIMGPIRPIGLMEPSPTLRSDNGRNFAWQAHKPSGSELFFDYISKLAVYFAIFLTALFFMNFSDVLGLSKQILISTLAFVSVAGWIGKTISAGNVSWRKNAVLWPALLVAISAVFSSFFSSSFWVSFLGDTGRFAFSGVSILSYIIIFAVAVQSFEKKDFSAAMWLWISSTFVVSAFGIAQIFGKFILPWDLYESRIFNTIGSPFHLAVFSASSLPLLAALWQGATHASSETSQGKKSFVLKSIIFVSAISQLVLTIIIDFRVAWISLAISSASLVFMNFKNPFGSGQESPYESGYAESARKEYQKNIVLPLFLIVLSVAMWLFVTAPSISGFSIPTEVNPSYSASFDVMTKTLKNWPVFGSGLETFPYVYARFKNAVLNQTNYWGVNFNDSIAEALTLPTVSGAFGTAAVLSFVIVFLLYGFKRVGARGGFAGGFSLSSARAGILASWIFILVSKFFYPTSLSLEFAFWILSALFVISTRGNSQGQTLEQESQRSDLENSPDVEQGELRYFFQAGSFKTLVVFFVLMAVLLGTLMGTYFSVKRFLSERIFVQALMTEDKAENRNVVIEKITSAIIGDPYELRYFRILSQVLFQKMNDVVSEIQKRQESERRATQEESALLQNLTVRTINSVQRAIALDPKNVGVLTDAAESYKALVSFVQGADDLAIQNYENASEMEPINPFIKTQLGQLYLIKSNLFGYTGAPVDSELAAKARGLFEEAVKLNPNYANGWYFLALMQDKAGEREAAMNNFRVLRATNPSNQLIAQITQNIENGIPALGYPPQPAVPPQSPSTGPAKGMPNTR